MCYIVFNKQKGTIYMKKDDKELEEISTTDKVKAMKALREAGLKVELSGSGVPTVVCASASDIEKEIKHTRKILKELRYFGSFGVRGPRKSDQSQPAEQNSEIEETSEEAVPA